MPEPLSQGPGWVPNTPFVPTDSQVAPAPRPADAIARSQQPMISSPVPSVYPDPLQSALKTRVTAVLSPLRTYQSDLADAMKAQNASQVSIASREIDQRKASAPAPEKSPSQIPKIVFVIAIVLLCAGLGFFGYALFVRFAPETKGITQQKAPASEVPTNVRRITNPLVSTESSQEVSLQTKTANGVADTLRSYRDNKGFLRLDLFQGETATPVSAQNFLSLFAKNALPELLRAFGSPFAFGYFSHEEKSDAYLILTTRAYSQVFSGMLSWEKDIVRDLGKVLLFPETEAAYRARVLETKNTLFVDEVISNKDVRVARDKDGTVFLLYGFLDTETLVITTSEEAFREIIDRVRSARIVR